MRPLEQAWQLLKEEDDDDLYANYPVPDIVDDATIDICNECGQPYDTKQGRLPRCDDCTQNALARSYHATGEPEIARFFSARPEQSDPNWQDSIETGEPMDIAWRLLKEAIPIMPYTREQDEFKAYRAVPTSRVQQILLEGLQPLPLDRTVMNDRAGSDFERINFALGIPLDEDDMALLEMENRTRQRFGQKPLPIRPPQESAIWTFGKRPKFPKTTHREMMDESLYNPLTSPLLAAQHFGDSFMSSRPTSIIASRVKPPGKIVEDTEFGRERGLARPQASFRGIAPEHLVEVMPVSDWNQTPITYDQWGQVNEAN
tara:strand:- start:810 stop:1757 length:948 start_codon:yes stop_codon:yes gene_type:complete